MFAYGLRFGNGPVGQRVRRIFSTSRTSAEPAAYFAAHPRRCIAIVFDLNGYTTHAREAVFAAAYRWVNAVAFQCTLERPGDYILSDVPVCPARRFSPSGRCTPACSP
jgi:hypothetical protein